MVLESAKEVNPKSVVFLQCCNDGLLLLRPLLRGGLGGNAVDLGSEALASYVSGEAKASLPNMPLTPFCLNSTALELVVERSK